MSANAFWVVVGNKLLLRDVHNNIIIPRAREIYELITGHTDRIENFEIDFPPKGLNPEVSFSRYPADLEIELMAERKERGYSFKAIVIAKYKDKITIVDDHPARMPDHILIGNEWHPFVNGVLEEICSIFRKAEIDEPGKLGLKQYLALRNLSYGNELIKDLTARAIESTRVAEVIRPEVPEPVLNARLYQYQKNGYRWLSWMASEGVGCILADEMGLGKTLQIIALLTERAGKYGPSLVICPATLQENWKREISRFSPSLRVLVHAGPERTGFPSEFKKHDVVITSYGIAVNDLILFSMVDWDVVAVDEAQAIRNPDALRTIKIKEIPRRVSIAITGTPLENRLMDLWSIMDFSVPGFLGSRNSFETCYEQDYSSAEKLEQRISPFILRRRVDEVARDLPDLIDIPVPLILTDKEALLYEETRKKISEQYEAGSGFAMLTHLSMICTHPFLLKDNTSKLDPAGESAKYTRLLEILDEIFSLKHRVIVFTTYIKMIDLLMRDISERYPDVYLNFIDGRVKINQRQKIIDEFNNYPGPALLALNPHAAGTGLNITGARHVIHYNLQWNPAVQDQATARAYRRGQRYPVTVHRMFYLNTIEDVMEENIQRKRNLANIAVVGVDGSAPDPDFVMKALAISPFHRDEE